jgi:hypothetical protein
VRATQSCVGNFECAFAWPLAVRGKREREKEAGEKSEVVSATFLQAFEE